MHQFAITYLEYKYKAELTGAHLRESNRLSKGWGTLAPIGRRVLPTRHFHHSVSLYLFFDFEPLLGKSEKFNNQGIKENKTFRIPFITKKQLKSRQTLHRVSWNLNTKYAEVPQSSILTHPFLLFFLFQKYLNFQVRTKKWY